ncbi:MAG: hypothetical protein LBT14_00485 [Treponema sp.]|nr:hypothetical protein [Treponema sp.]
MATTSLSKTHSTPVHIAHQYHDYQHEGSPSDYFAPELEPQALSRNTLEEALGGILNMVYRAYRVSYEWVPQLAAPQEALIAPPDPAGFRV